MHSTGWGENVCNSRKARTNRLQTKKSRRPIHHFWPSLRFIVLPKLPNKTATQSASNSAWKSSQWEAAAMKNLAQYWRCISFPIWDCLEWAKPISYCPVSTEAQASAKSWITPSTRQESSSVSSLKVFLQMKWQTNTGLLSGPFPISPFCKGSTRARLVQQNLHPDLGRSFPDFEEAGPQVSCWQTTKAHSWSHCPNLY